MGRTYVAWALANMALRDPGRRDEYLAPLDRIIADTLRLEREHGLLYFLLPYGRARPFVESPARSLFVDGEIALMLALRRLVAEDDAAKREYDVRAAFISERMARGPVSSAESYPNECWMFCNAVALAALRVGDALDRTDYGPLARRLSKRPKLNWSTRPPGCSFRGTRSMAPSWRDPRAPASGWSRTRWRSSTSRSRAINTPARKRSSPDPCSGSDSPSSGQARMSDHRTSTPVQSFLSCPRAQGRADSRSSRRRASAIARRSDPC